MNTLEHRLPSRGWRSRWAAIGAAVAVTLGASGLMVANAASGEPSSFVSVDPTRVLDTRTDVGLSGPFVRGVSQKLTVTGPVRVQPPGNAAARTETVVPTGATAVVMNATAVVPRTGGFLSVRPGDATGVPATSNINLTPFQTLANSVTVQLPTSGSAAGTIDIFIDGEVDDVLIDIVGYYVPTSDVGPVTLVPFEVLLNFDGSQTIAENGDLTLSLRCREDDQTPDQTFSATNRNNMQFRAFSFGEYMTTYIDTADVYENEGVTIARALGSSSGDTVQTTFITRDGVFTGASMTAPDGRQIAVDGDSVQVMFNVNHPVLTGGQQFDCYARGVAMIVEPSI